MFEGQRVKTGGVVSNTATLKVHDAWLRLESVAVTVMVDVPMGRKEGRLGGSSETELELSVALMGRSAGGTGNTDELLATENVAFVGQVIEGFCWSVTVT